MSYLHFIGNTNNPGPHFALKTALIFHFSYEKWLWSCSLSVSLHPQNCCLLGVLCCYTILQKTALHECFSAFNGLQYSPSQDFLSISCDRACTTFTFPAFGVRICILPAGMYQVILRWYTSAPCRLYICLLQGSVIFLLFSLYPFLGEVIPLHILYHCYAGDTELFLSFHPSNTS